MELLPIYFFNLLQYNNYRKEEQGEKNEKRKNKQKRRNHWRCTHTHTHTSTFRKIKRVANEATLYCVEDRMTVALYVEKQCKQDILFFACNFYQ